MGSEMCIRDSSMGKPQAHFELSWGSYLYIYINECLCVCFQLEATVLVQMGSKGAQKMQNHTEKVPKLLKISDSGTTKKYFWGGIF